MPKPVTLHDLVTIEAGLFKTLPHGCKYSSFQAFVLANGAAFPQAPFPAKYVAGLPRSCFRNAASLVRRSKKLLYVEGYCLDVKLPLFPVHHGWAVTMDGEVIDPTPYWHEPGRETEYLGVPFTLSFVRSHPTPVYDMHSGHDLLAGKFGKHIDTALVARMRAAKAA